MAMASNTWWPLLGKLCGQRIRGLGGEQDERHLNRRGVGNTTAWLVLFPAYNSIRENSPNHLGHKAYSRGNIPGHWRALRCIVLVS
jgi:hypothetical protein